MVRRFAVALAVVMFVLVTAQIAFAQVPVQAQPQAVAPAEVNLAAALAQTRWQGAIPPAEAMQNKGAIVLIYATWCPKCNEWSPELFAQLQKSVVEQPVFIFAINADKTTPGSRYAVERGLVGPNIVHGYDPTVPAKLGFDSELFRFVVFDPQGKLVSRGNAGSFYDKPTGKEYALASQLNEGRIPGEFSILDRSMAAPVKQALWPIELGQAANEKSLTKLRSQVPAANQEEFNTAIRAYLDKHLARVEEGQAADVPAKIQAFQSARLLADRFASTAQGKKAKEIITQLEEDQQFKKEVSAAGSYQKALVTGSTPAGKKRALLKVARLFPGTHFGDLAQQQAEQAEATP